MLNKLREKLPDHDFLSHMLDHPKRPQILIGFAVLTVILIILIDIPFSVYMTTQEGWVLEALRYSNDMGNSKWFLVTYLAWMFAAYALTHITDDEELSARARKLAWTFLFLAGCIILSGLIVDILKPIIGRARPYMVLEDKGFWSPFTFSSRYYSLPSGHSATMFSAAAGLSILFWKAPRPFHIALYAIALFGAVARIAARKHFASDVLVGSTIGVIASFWLAHYFTRKGWLDLLPSPHTATATDTPQNAETGNPDVSKDGV